MVESQRRTSLLGVLALLGGLASLGLSKFNVTPWHTIPVGSLTLPLGTVVGLGATAVALLAFLAAASSPRTGTGVPLVALLVCAAALVLAFKPNLFATWSPSSAAKPAVPATAPPPATSAPPPTEDAPAPHVKTIFDSDYPSSTPNPTLKSTIVAPSDSESSSATVAPAPQKLDHADAIRAARAKIDAARAEVLRQLESSPAYRAAKSEADAADAELKQARLTNPPGSPELISASEAAMAAHSKLQKLIADAAAKHPASQEAARELRAAH